jgi:ABC-2 type transport system ATP-binding protein
MSDPILETRGLTVKFGKKAAVDGVDIAFRRGEAAVIAGPNGAGKSTFLKCLAGAIIPDRGSVIPARGLSRKSIGFISDKLSLYENWILDEAWRFHREVYGIPQPARPTFEGLDLDGRRKIKRLSVGERTLFHLSLIMAQKPALLLIDEVVYGIDAYLREKFLETVIEAIDAFQAAVVMVNHTFTDTAQIPERVLIMDRGRFVLDARREELERKVKKVLAEGPWPSDIPVLFETGSELRKERYVYPFNEEWRGRPGLVFEDIGLGEIVKAFIGGAYVQKRAR